MAEQDIQQITSQEGYQHSYKSSTHWKWVPILPGNWRVLSLSDTCALLARLAAQELADGIEASAWGVTYRRARALRLEPYPQWLLVEAEAEMPDGETGCSYFFYGPKRRLLPVRWEVATLNILDALNREAGIALQPSLAYVMLRMNLAAFDGSRFALLNSAADLPVLDGSDFPDEVAQRIKPPHILRQRQGGVTLVEGVVLYQGELHETTLRLHPDGQIEMDEGVEFGLLPLSRERIEGIFRIVDGVEL